MIGGDHGIAGGHRFGVGDPEPFARRWRGEHARHAHVTEDVIVLVQEPEEIDPIRMVQSLGLSLESGGFGSDGDDAERRIAPVGHRIERIKR